VAVFVDGGGRGRGNSKKKQKSAWILWSTKDHKLVLNKNSTLFGKFIFMLMQCPNIDKNIINFIT
jgi:hypothetical protein